MTLNKFNFIKCDMKKKKNEFRFSAEKFKAERIAQKITFGKFAEALKKYNGKASKSLVFKWEHGSQPSYLYISAICEILKKDLSFFSS